MKSSLLRMMILFLWMTPRASRADAPNCAAGEGLWLTSDGETVCRPCPQTTHFAAGRALKLPVSCIALTQGIHLNMSTYTELRTREAVADRLTTFQGRLEPLLDALSTQLEVASQQAEEIKQDTARITTENRKLESDISSLRLQREILIIVSSALAVSTYISLF